MSSRALKRHILEVAAGSDLAAIRAEFAHLAAKDVLNVLFAERYHQEPERVASLVLIGNLAALVFLPLALALVL